MRRLLTAALLLLTPGLAAANERHFTYTYESAVLPPGAREIEVWSTARLGREQLFNRYDERLEFEMGLTERLQGSLYLNLTGSTQRVGDELVRSAALQGFSAELKYKLLDPVADTLGLALYGEAGFGPDELELEAKLILDKRMGDLLLAANLVLENEFEYEVGELEPEFTAELALGATYFLAHNLSLGVELRSVNPFPEGEGWEYSALYAGPTLAYSQEKWWLALSLLPQLPALKKPEGSTRSVVLEGQERFQARLLFSFALD